MDILRFGHADRPCMLDRGHDSEHIGPMHHVDDERCRFVWLRSEFGTEVHLRTYADGGGTTRDVAARVATRWERIGQMPAAMAEQYAYLRQHGSRSPARWRCVVSAFALARAALFRRVVVG